MRVLIAAAGAAMLMTDALAGERRIQPLTDGWKFVREDIPAAFEPRLDDAAWQPVTVPHTWNSRDGQDGGNDYYRGGAWYRRWLTLPAERGRCFLRFGAANSVAEVFFDGQRLAEHRGGYTAFCVELPRPAHGGARHVVAVRVDNRHDDDLPPWDADYTFFGGLYRDVSLIHTADVCISPLVDGASGVRIITENASSESADFHADVLVDALEPTEILLRTTVRDSRGQRVAGQSSTHALPGGSRVLRHAFSLRAPRLWRGRRDPHLYSIQVDILRDGHVIDSVRERFGLRTFQIDADRGFMLNGELYPLRGVNKHQDRLDKGWAISSDDIREDFAIIAELGATSVRLAHYPHDPLAYELCDELGLVVWAEIPLINRINDTAAFRENTHRMLREMIRQHCNHPSIVVWGLHNEITAPWKPGPDATALVSALHDAARREDPTRLTTSAGTVPWDHAVNWIADAPAFNRYEGWYVDAAQDLGPRLDEMRKTHPGRPIGLGEYGAGGSIHQHELPTVRPQPASPWHPEEYQAAYHETAWRAIAARPWLWCTHVWNMFDFAADQRNEGDQPGRNDKGLVTYDRRTRKDAFWFYKANWSDEPVLYIADRRFARRTDSPARVKVYSNAGQVALRINGRDVGSRTGETAVFVWDQLTLEPGENHIEVAAEFDGRVLTDACVWTCADER